MGKIIAAVFLAMGLAGCAYNHALPPEQFVVQQVVETPGISKERIFEKSKIWFARTFRQPMSRWSEQSSTRTVLQYANEGKGLLVANGAILYPHEGFSTESYKTGWEVRFTLEVDARDNRAKIVFSHLTMFVPSVFCGYYSQSTNSYERPLYDDELEKVKTTFLDLANQFGVYLAAQEEKW